MRDVVCELLAKLRGDKPIVAEVWEEEYCTSVCQMTGYGCSRLKGDDDEEDIVKCEKLVAARVLFAKERDRVTEHYANDVLNFAKKESVNNIKAELNAVAQKYHDEFNWQLPQITSLVNPATIKDIKIVNDRILKAIQDANK